jgi:ubiquinone/menaquinone biosynthesis C-methylase UbiE
MPLKRCQPHRGFVVFGCLLAILALSTSVAGGQDAVQTSRIRENNRREGWQRVPDILVALGVVPGARVADVGAGDGFFTVQLARAVGPGGRVIAEDISHEALDRLRARLADEVLTNVDVVQGELDDPHLPSDSLDGILIVNAYHEMDQFAAMLGHLGRALKPGGRLVLVEPLDPRLRGEARARQTKDHSLDAGFAERELRAAGFDVTGLRDPFIRRDQHEEWLMVAERGPDARGTSAGVPSASPTPSPASLPAGTDPELAAPALRISQEQFKTLLRTGSVLLLDVRDVESYVAGHLPGAVLMPLEDLADRLPEVQRGSGPVVTYCS